MLNMVFAFVLCFQPENPDFKEQLGILDNASKNIHNEKFYEKFTFKNEKTGEEKSLKDFDKFDQKLIMLFMTEKLTRDLTETHKEWSQDKENTDFVKQLQEIRKNTAKRYESYVGKLHKDYPEKFSKEEKALYVKKMVEFHNKEKLVNR